jgi:hypothetical protein
MHILPRTSEVKWYAALFQPIYQQFNFWEKEIDFTFIKAIHSAIDEAWNWGEIELIETNVVHCFIASGNHISIQTSKYIADIFEHSQHKKVQLGWLHSRAVSSAKQFQARALSAI